MLDAHVSAVLSRIAPGDRVLDVGGWARCFNRADSVIDKFPYETRGARYGDRLGLGPQGGEVERFSSATWITRDLCDREPWPFPDKYFDFCTCSHTLEDIRDPLWVCSEIRRVACAGYIETPSMAFELTRGREPGVPVGLSHHFWVVEANDSGLTFHPKLHGLHGDPRLSLPPDYGAALPPDELVTWLFWEGDLAAREGWLHRDAVEQFVASHGPFPDEARTDAIDADHRILELTLANREALALIWDLRSELAHANQQWHSTRDSLRIVEGQLAEVIALLHETAADRDAALARLAPIEGAGPTTLSVARRLHQLSKRHPRLGALLRRVVRAA